MSAYLSICSIFRNDADYLAEWVELHRLVGAERFFLYDNFSDDNWEQVLRPYTEQGIVTVHEWNVPFDEVAPGSSPKALLTAYEHCLEHHASESRWIAFLDVDEFLFSPTGAPVADLLREYEQHPAVGVNWAMYGTSGHRHKPEGLVIENYLHRTDDARINGYFKSIVDPGRVARCSNSAHHFVYRDGVAVNENHEPIISDRPSRSEPVSFARLRVNHYWTRSEQEARRKLALWESTGTPRSWSMVERRNRHLADCYDDSITGYVPAVKRALEARD